MRDDFALIAMPESEGADRSRMRSHSASAKAAAIVRKSVGSPFPAMSSRD